jgi:hypothetical protein
MQPFIGPLLALATFVCAASPAIAAPSPQALDLARRYFAAANMDQKVRASLRVLTPSLTEQMVRKNPQLTQPQRDQLMQAVIEAEQEAARRMVERLVPAFAESFSEAELKDIVVFYESPAGKALTAKTPAFAGQINMAFRAYAPQMLADINTRFCAKIGCRLKPAALTSPPSNARPSPP